MGAWGSGPFDNDAALDFLGDLADQYAITDETGTIKSVDHTPVTSALRAALESATTGGPHYEPESAYAAAGLVAAVLTGTPATNTGTRMFSAGNAEVDGQPDIGLSAHCGYLALLAPQDATDLKALARAAVAALAADDDWVSSWIAVISEPLDALAAHLA